VGRGGFADVMTGDGAMTGDGDGATTAFAGGVGGTTGVGGATGNTGADGVNDGRFVAVLVAIGAIGADACGGRGDGTDVGGIGRHEGDDASGGRESGDVAGGAMGRDDPAGVDRTSRLGTAGGRGGVRTVAVDGGVTMPGIEGAAAPGVTAGAGIRADDAGVGTAGAIGATGTEPGVGLAIGGLRSVSSSSSPLFHASTTALEIGMRASSPLIGVSVIYSSSTVA